MAKHFNASVIDVHQLAAVVRNHIDNILILDSRSFWEYNSSHVTNAVNVGCAKLMKRRLQQDKLSIQDFLAQNCHWEVDRSIDIIVYDQNTEDPKHLLPDSFLSVFLQKLLSVYNSVNVVKGGFLEFQTYYPNLCENENTKFAPLTSLSQPCLPISNQGPTRILPFLYLGSQHDALDKDLLQKHNITYQLNVSTNCPKPDFIQEAHFMRIPVIDNYSEKLLPHFSKACQFLDKVRESGGCALVHCLAGISRSATIAIAYVMRYLKMSSDDAYRYVKSKRATISPNFNFLGQLLEYENQLQKENILKPKKEISVTPVIGTQSVAFNKQLETDIFPNAKTKHKLSNQNVVCCNLSRSSSEQSNTSYSLFNNGIMSTRKKCLSLKQTITINSTKISNCFKKNLCVKQRSDNKTSLLMNEISSGRLEKSHSNSCINENLSSNADCFIRSKTPNSSKYDVNENIPSVELWSSVEDSSTHSLIPQLEFDKKEYSRSDSTSTSGLGSEGSECLDSWNDYHSSYEREMDMLMDDEYAIVPSESEEFHRQERVRFDDSYEEASLYPKRISLNAELCRPGSPVSPSEEHFKDNFTLPLKRTQGTTSELKVKNEIPYNCNNSQYQEKALDNRNSLINSIGCNEKYIAKMDGLYRAQSCPGMLPSSEINSTPNTKAPLMNSAPVRRTHVSNAHKNDKYRNRYSCSSLDYMEYVSRVGVIPESCPDVLCSADSDSKSATILSSTHPTFRHSMIEVS